MIHVFVILERNINSVMEESKRQIHAVVGVVFDQSQECIVISKRQPHQSFSGYWELPGGKIEPNESLADALKRELAEELDIVVTDLIHLGTHTNYFKDYSVKVEVCKIISFSNFPIGKEGQEIRWIGLDRVLDVEPLLPGSEEIINLIKIKQ